MGCLARLVSCVAVAAAFAVQTAWADDGAGFTLPTFFQADGIEAPNVLRIRAEPARDAAVLGAERAGARNIEVVEFDATGNWARVHVGGVTGWARTGQMSPQAAVWDAGKLPPTLRCFGRNPAWSFRIDGDTVMLTTAQRAEAALRLSQVLDTQTPRDPRRAFVATQGSQSITAVMVPKLCTDPRDGNVYGLDVTVIVDNRMETGCCSISR
ncbi:MAG: hypothetical protein JJT81_16310 [Rubellimicrobium sp.]|nr:hypothetical protein [Rubellimicrobium sp.]